MMSNLSENFCVHSVGHMSLQEKRQEGFERVRGISPTLMYRHYKATNVADIDKLQVGSPKLGLKSEFRTWSFLQKLIFQPSTHPTTHPSTPTPNHPSPPRKVFVSYVGGRFLNKSCLSILVGIKNGYSNSLGTEIWPIDTQRMGRKHLSLNSVTK